MKYTTYQSLQLINNITLCQVYSVALSSLLTISSPWALSPYISRLSICGHLPYPWWSETQNMMVAVWRDLLTDCWLNPVHQGQTATWALHDSGQNKWGECGHEICQQLVPCFLPPCVTVQEQTVQVLPALNCFCSTVKLHTHLLWKKRRMSLVQKSNFTWVKPHDYRAFYNS